MDKKTDYLEQSPSIKRYVSRLSPGSVYNALYTIHYFIEYYQENSPKFRDMTIDELVEYQRQADNGSQYDVLDILIDWINSMELRHTTLKQRYNQIRGLFKACRAELPSETMNFQPDRPKVRGRLTVENLRDILLSCNTLYRAVYLCMFMGGMGQEEFIYWSDNGYTQLVKDLKNNPEYIQVYLPGRKSNKFKQGYYTLISGDALDALKAYHAERGREPGAIFINQWGSPLSKRAVYLYWLRKITALGLYKSKPSVRIRSGMGVHELRDLFRTQWEKSPSTGSVAEYMMGHTVDPNDYNQAHRDVKWVWSEYRKALPKLNLLSSSEPYGLVDSDRVQQLEAEISQRDQRLEALESQMMKYTAALEALYNNPELAAKLKKP